MNNDRQEMSKEELHAKLEKIKKKNAQLSDQIRNGHAFSNLIYQLFLTKDDPWQSNESKTCSIWA